ncbi:MAG TPA: acetyl-CoA acetyltransferase [Sphingomonas sp.]|nr:acetyl-CoA acetyltransferase [Sphingomonas sp.]
MLDPARTPVIVGVGQVSDRTEDPAAALDPVGLMAAALRDADVDAGGGWLARVGSLAVVDQISFRALNPVVDAVADALGMTPAHRVQTPGPMGDSPVRLLAEAANRIRSGAATVCAVVGGEALRTAARRAALAAGGSAADHNAMRGRHRERAPDYRQRYGLVAPVDVYPLYENATRAAWGQTLAEAQAESAAMWAHFSRVAADNPAAWLRTPRTADEIATPAPTNRPIAFPYLKLMVANIAVNQGAGFIVTSLAEARARGVADHAIVHVGLSAAAHESDDVMARDRFDASAGMRVSLEQTLRRNGVTIGEIDRVELYSCFPCVPKMARRILGWPLDRAGSVVGGLTFGGGPIGNYMSHAVAAMVLAQRAEGGTGLLFGNGGFATHNHSILLSSDPIAAAETADDFDCQALADAARNAAPPVDEAYAGAARIETYTVFYDREGAARQGVVVARNDAGARFLAVVREKDAVRVLTSGDAEPVGMQGIAVRGADGLVEWGF